MSEVPRSADSDYWAMAKMADLLSEIVATPNVSADLELRKVRAAELQAIESHLLRRLIEAQSGALVKAAETLKSD